MFNSKTEKKYQKKTTKYLRKINIVIENNTDKQLVKTMKGDTINIQISTLKKKHYLLKSRHNNYNCPTTCCMCFINKPFWR